MIRRLNSLDIIHTNFEMDNLNLNIKLNCNTEYYIS